MSLYAVALIMAVTMPAIAAEPPAVTVGST